LKIISDYNCFDVYIFYLISISILVETQNKLKSEFVPVKHQILIKFKIEGRVLYNGKS